MFEQGHWSPTALECSYIFRSPGSLTRPHWESDETFIPGCPGSPPCDSRSWDFSDSTVIYAVGYVFLSSGEPWLIHGASGMFLRLVSAKICQTCEGLTIKILWMNIMLCVWDKSWVRIMRSEEMMKRSWGLRRERPLVLGHRWGKTGSPHPGGDS